LVESRALSFSRRHDHAAALLRSLTLSFSLMAHSLTTNHADVRPTVHRACGHARHVRLKRLPAGPDPHGWPEGTQQPGRERNNHHGSGLCNTSLHFVWAALQAMEFARHVLTSNTAGNKTRCCQSAARLVACRSQSGCLIALFAVCWHSFPLARLSSASADAM